MGNHGRPPIRTSGGGAAQNIKASITRRAADVCGRCLGQAMAIKTLDEYLETIPNEALQS